VKHEKCPAAISEQKRTLVPLGGENRHTSHRIEICLAGPRSGGAPLVSVVKTANLRNGNNRSRLQRLYGSRFGRILGQRKVRPGCVIVREEGLHVPVQRSLVEDDHVIEALAANRADDAFHVGSLPWRARRRKDFLDSHGFDTLRKLTAEDAVVVPQQVTRDLLKGKGLPELLRGPLGRRMGGDLEMDASYAGRVGLCRSPAAGCRASFN
jgi:hypothetical protein